MDSLPGLTGGGFCWTGVGIRGDRKDGAGVRSYTPKPIWASRQGKRDKLARESLGQTGVHSLSRGATTSRLYLSVATWECGPKGDKSSNF